MKYLSPILKFSLPLVTLLAVPLAASASDMIMPAGSVIQCTVAEPKISSKVDKIGDPVLCQVSHSELRAYGRAVVPFGSYMVGHFEDYKDPGHFVGKGWIELRFDRMILPDDTVIPLDARVVSVPGYPVDSDGKIHGNGHPVKDTIEWFIPVLWPLDIINLPRRGPRVVLKAETRLTLKGDGRRRRICRANCEPAGDPVRSVAAPAARSHCSSLCTACSGSHARSSDRYLQQLSGAAAAAPTAAASGRGAAACTAGSPASRFIRCTRTRRHHPRHTATAITHDPDSFPNPRKMKWPWGKPSRPFHLWSLLNRSLRIGELLREILRGRQLRPIPSAA